MIKLAFMKNMLYLRTQIKQNATRMKLRFTINYNTAWGESMHVKAEYVHQDGSFTLSDIAMTTDDGSLWTVEAVVMESRRHPIVAVRYRYVVENASGDVVRSEWGLVPRLFSCDTSRNYLLPDEWRDYPLQSHLFTNAYAATKGFPRDEQLRAIPLPQFRRTIIFRVVAPQIKEGEAMAIVGSHPVMGSWNASRYLSMQYAGNRTWMLSIDASALALPLEYKYVVVNKATQNIERWEDGDNRQIADDTIGEGTILVADGGLLRLPEDMWRVAGVAVPVFSLRSNHSYGVGDFGDIKLLADWAARVGMKMIQLLPVNDTTITHSWTDSYPYNAVSVYALHPHYIDLEAAGVLKDKQRMNAYHRQQQELNNIAYSDYEAVDRVKMSYLKELYQERGYSKNIDVFVNDNKEWIYPYAAFSILRDRHNTSRSADWHQLAHYDEKEVAAFIEKEASEEAKFIFFAQYVLHNQLKEACDYARSIGVAVEGDMPIGVSRDSVDTWVNPEYFNLDSQTGAPPEEYNRRGQNWGFPTYNWQSLMADDCRWWRKRLAHSSLYFDAMRIDHVLGFFRIWEIPADAVYSNLGHFSPSLPMTVEEIEYFGLQFRKEFMTRPFINDNIVERLFGIHAQYVRENFLNRRQYGLYALKEEYSTQRKIEAHFCGKNDENSLWIRDALYQLAANVLFVEDPRQRDMYHPRIDAWRELVFDTLADDEKAAYMRLYNNYFYQRHNMYWGNIAMHRLTSVLSGTRMLPCAENLGMLPECVSPVLDALRILTLEVQSMPRQDCFEFAHLEGNPYRSVATFSTHDMSPLRLWWEENRERTQRYYVTMLQKEGRAPEHLPAHLAEEIIARHLYCPSMACILALQDWLAMDSELRGSDVWAERINVPSDSYNRWRYRMNMTLETLIASSRYNDKLKTMITRSKR